MNTFEVYDTDGQWVVNNCLFGFVDIQGRSFAPGTQVKVMLDEGSWAKAQLDAGVLTKCDAPELLKEPVEPDPVSVKVSKDTGPAT